MLSLRIDVVVMILISVALKLVQLPPQISRCWPRVVGPESKGNHTIPSNQPVDAGHTQVGSAIGHVAQSLHSEHPVPSTNVTVLAGSIGINGPLICASPEDPERLPFRFAKPQSLNHQPAQI